MPLSTVYFLNPRTSRGAPFHVRVKRLLAAAGATEGFRAGELTAIKIHFGEAGVTGFVSPLRVKPIVEVYREAGAKPFLTDTATLYVGQRGEAVSHALVAAAHGFDPNILGAPVIIADGLTSTNEAAVAFGGSRVPTAYLAGDIVAADRLVNVAHFKGHEMAGYGGALKNIAMGCATRRGKMHQHGVIAPRVLVEKCIGCGQCVAVCAHEALTLTGPTGAGKKPSAVVDPERCVGCGACFQACPTGAMDINWQTDIAEFLKRMMEYAAAALLTRQTPTLHINFAMAISPDCDCMGFSDSPICPDLGVLASWDPVALDQACLDLANGAVPLYPSKLPLGLAPGDNKFEALHPHVPKGFGLDYAESIGLGSRSYELKSV